nr:NADH dehydrogenase subunit F [Dendrobium heterocarpum]
MSFSNASMLRLVTSSNLIQIYIFWELVGMFSYLLIGFWFTTGLTVFYMFRMYLLTFDGFMFQKK